MNSFVQELRITSSALIAIVTFAALSLFSKVYSHAHFNRAYSLCSYLTRGQSNLYPWIRPAAASYESGSSQKGWDVNEIANDDSESQYNCIPDTLNCPGFNTKWVV